MAIIQKQNGGRRWGLRLAPATVTSTYTHCLPWGAVVKLVADFPCQSQINFSIAPPGKRKAVLLLDKQDRIRII